MKLDLDELERRTQDVQGWANTSEAWENTDYFEDEDPRVQMPAWIVGAIDEDVYFDVAVVDCEQYGIPGESEKLAKFYAAANPAVVLELVRRLRDAEKAADRMREALQSISTMQDQPYYKVCPADTAKDAHLIAVGALANRAEAGDSIKENSNEH